MEAKGLRLAKHRTNPLGTHGLDKLPRNRPRLSMSQKVSVLPIPSPAPCPAGTKANHPAIRCPVRQSRMTALRTRRGRHTESAQDEATEERAPAAHSTVHKDILVLLKLWLVI